MSECKGKQKRKEPLIRRFKSICVFGGSKLGKDGEFTKVANELGRELAARKINLVYEGGVEGLKGCVAGSAIITGSDVLGITVKNLHERGILSFTLGTELKVSSMHEKLAYMIYHADAFIAIPGGLETLEGVVNITSWMASNLHRKPLGLLNINGFYDGLLSFLDAAVEQGFITQASRSMIVIASKASQLIDLLQASTLEPSAFEQQEERHDKENKKQGPDTTLRL